MRRLVRLILHRLRRLRERRTYSRWSFCSMMGPNKTPPMPPGALRNSKPFAAIGQRRKSHPQGGANESLRRSRDGAGVDVAARIGRMVVRLRPRAASVRGLLLVAQAHLTLAHADTFEHRS